MAEFSGTPTGRGRRFAVLSSRFNEHITQKLVDGAMDALMRHGASYDDVDVVWVPGAWELPALHEAWEAGGLAAVAEQMTAPGDYTEQAITGAAASRSTRPVMARPVLVHPTGFRMSPYADIKPAGEETRLAARRAAAGPRNPAAPRKLWHSSPGSSGR